MSISVEEIRSEDPEIIDGAAIATCLTSLAMFLERYKPRVHRAEQEEHLQVYVEGLVSGVERKSIEPIATAHGLYRRPLQHFVGAGAWSDDKVRSEMREHVVEEIGDPKGVFILDGSGNKKQGTDSVGVARQYCGRLGKIDNCQIGIYLAYSTPKGFTLLDTDLYLPEDWANDPARREKTYVPEGVEFRTNWQIADDLLRRASPHVPHAWVVGDDEYGRPTEFRGSAIFVVTDDPRNFGIVSRKEASDTSSKCPATPSCGGRSTGPDALANGARSRRAGSASRRTGGSASGCATVRRGPSKSAPSRRTWRPNVRARPLVRKPSSSWKPSMARRPGTSSRPETFRSTPLNSCASPPIATI
jgi:hypothetical protein